MTEMITEKKTIKNINNSQIVITNDTEIDVSFSDNIVTFTDMSDPINKFEFNYIKNPTEGHNCVFMLDFSNPILNKIKLTFIIKSNGWKYSPTGDLTFKKHPTDVSDNVLTIHAPKTKTNGEELGELFLNVDGPSKSKYKIDPMFSRRRT
ncbi:MAG: hypothetical protein HRU38_19485 [Saccharospirillaceae bacterium]|nr:hypothetical protein [Pseudomonadales bacterium]NRB80820.1 hypothetical protein [Saccharospirillaceae bacterium]